MAELLRRVEVLEAVGAITRLTADYSFAADHRDLDLFLSVWADNAEWEVSPHQVFIGREEIASAIERQWHEAPRAFHWSSNPAITMDADGLGASGRHDAHTQVQLNDGTWLEIAATYVDRYAKTAVGWKLVRRAAHVHSQRPA